jgi:hypothetical protein
MRLAPSIGWLGLTACVGCSDVLGLDDLSFDRRLSNEAPPAALQPSMDSGVVTLDAGDPLVPRYPARWRDSQMLVMNAVPTRDDTYLVYDRSTGEIESHRATSDTYRVTRIWQWVAGFTQVIQVPTDTGGVAWLGYHADGWLDYVAPVPTDTHVIGESTAASPGRTHMIAVSAGASWFLLSYDTKTGNYRIGPIALNGPDAGAVYADEWATGWSSLLAYPLESGWAILKYNATSGAAELDTVNDGGEGTTLLHTAIFSPGWTTIATFQRGSQTRLLLYDAPDGNVAVAELDLSSGMTLRTEYEEVWREQITAVETLQIGSAPFAVTHSGVGGIVDVVSLDPLDSSPAVR